MTVLPAPACPTCREELTLQADDTFDAWVCPSGHGLAFTLSEAYERLRDNEIRTIWRLANVTPRAEGVRTSTRGCPMCSATMLAVPCDAVTLDVCVIDEVLWFDAGELDQLPPDVAEATPSAEETAELETVTEQFGDALTAGWDAEEQATITGRLTTRLLRSRTASTAS